MPFADVEPVEVWPILHESAGPVTGAGQTAGVTAQDIEDLLRELAPQVLGALVRRYGHFARCEDAVQEALLAAAARSGPARACRTTRAAG